MKIIQTKRRDKKLTKQGERKEKTEGRAVRDLNWYNKIGVGRRRGKGQKKSWVVGCQPNHPYTPRCRGRTTQTAFAGGKPGQTMPERLRRKNCDKSVISRHNIGKGLGDWRDP